MNFDLKATFAFLMLKLLHKKLNIKCKKVKKTKLILQIIYKFSKLIFIKALMKKKKVKRYGIQLKL